MANETQIRADNVKFNFCDRKRREYGEKFDPSDLADQFWPYLQRDDLRVTVARKFADGTILTRRGRIGVTTGWKPCFLLMSRINAIGSSNILSHDDQIIAVNPRRIRKGR